MPAATRLPDPRDADRETAIRRQNNTHRPRRFQAIAAEAGARDERPGAAKERCPVERIRQAHAAAAKARGVFRLDGRRLAGAPHRDVASGRPDGSPRGKRGNRQSLSRPAPTHSVEFGTHVRRRPQSDPVQTGSTDSRNLLSDGKSHGRRRTGGSHAVSAGSISETISTPSEPRPGNASAAMASASVSNVSNARPVAISTMVKRASGTGAPRRSGERAREQLRLARRRAYRFRSAAVVRRACWTPISVVRR